MSARGIKVRLTRAQFDVVIGALAYYETVLDDDVETGVPGAAARRRSLMLATDKIAAGWRSRVSGGSGEGEARARSPRGR